MVDKGLPLANTKEAREVEKGGFLFLTPSGSACLHVVNGNKSEARLHKTSPGR
jgi:hypothetical protein